MRSQLKKCCPGLSSSQGLTGAGGSAFKKTHPREDGQLGLAVDQRPLPQRRPYRMLESSCFIAWSWLPPERAVPGRNKEETSAP